MIDMNKFNELLSGFQEKAKEMDEQSESTIHTAKSGGGLIEVSANGKGEVVDIIIDDTLLEDKESLQILLMSAVNDVYKNVEESRKSAAMSMLGDINPFGQQ